MKLRTLSFFIVFLCNYITAQNYIYKQFGCKDGLPSLQVYGLHQDNNGLIWYATDRGLANFNGYEFKKYGIEDGILNNVILAFYPQKDGTVYAVTIDNKLFSFKNDTSGFTPYPYNDLVQKEYYSDRFHIKSLQFDEDGSLHLGSEAIYGKVIISKDGEIRSKPYYKKGISINYVIEQFANNIIGFHYDSINKIQKKNTLVYKTATLLLNLAVSLKDEKHIAFTNDNSVYVVDKKGNVITKIENEYNPIGIRELKGDHFFVGYHFGGAIIYDSKGNIKKQFLKGKSVSDCLIDNEGGYWFSTLNSGAYYVRESQLKQVNDLIDIPITSITKSNAGELYVGNDNGDVLKIVPNDKTSIKDNLPKITVEYKSNRHIKAFVEYDSENDALYVKSGKTFYKKDAKGKKDFSAHHRHTLKLSEPLAQKVLKATNVSVFSVDTKNNTIHEINTPFRVEDACFTNTAMYVGTYTGAYTIENEKKVSMIPLDSVFKNRIDDIDANLERNEVYFGSLGAGVIILNETTKKVKVIDETDGLFSNIVNEVYVGEDNELLVCTNFGLNRIKFAHDGSFEVTGVKSSEGLLSDGISDVEVLNDTVWIASKNGLLYAPKKLFNKQEKNNSYFLRVKEISVNDKTTNKAQLAELSHTENRLAFKVEGVSFKHANKLLYGYTLKGLDDKWYYTTNRTINYSSLPYGKYTFKLTALTSEKDEKLEIIEIPIHIYPPLWKRTWFVIAAILSFVFLIYLFFKYRILSYNRHIISELLRLLVKKINREEKYFSFKESGKEVRVKTSAILYVKSSGNYIELVTEKKNYIIRTPIRSFIESTPDPLEYIRIHRSYVIRIDKVTAKNNKEVIINKEKLPVSSSYLDELDKLIF